MIGPFKNDFVFATNNFLAWNFESTFLTGMIGIRSGNWERTIENFYFGVCVLTFSFSSFIFMQRSVSILSEYAPEITKFIFPTNRHVLLLLVVRGKSSGNENVYKIVLMNYNRDRRNKYVLKLDSHSNANRILKMRSEENLVRSKNFYV